MVLRVVVIVVDLINVGFTEVVPTGAQRERERFIYTMGACD